MERRGLDLPLLIGGATTSRQHTAVKIAPAYSRADRARARRLPRRRRRLRPARRRRAAQQLDADNRELQERLREQHAEKTRKPLLPLDAGARERASASRSTSCRSRRSRAPARSSPTSRRCASYIDWQFFFHAWELKGKFPAILERPEARSLFDDATELLDEIVAGSSLQARGVYGFWPARARGRRHRARRDALLACCASSRPTATRARTARLADYVAPAGDHLGAFAVAIHGADELAARFEAELDDYQAIMVKALADRLAEAFAEWLHAAGAARVVRDRARAARSEELIAESFRGIRPAFGYPACPDHTEKRKLFDLLGAERRRPRR